MSDSEKRSSGRDHPDFVNNVNARYGSCMIVWRRHRLIRRWIDRIQNPLHGIPHDTLLAQVDAFAQEYKMEDILPILQKGALLAQDPGQFESIKELDEKDLEVIRREKTRGCLMFLSEFC